MSQDTLQFPDARKRLTAARTRLVLDEPFFGALALRLALVEDVGCKTAWVDGVSLGYDPTFIMSLKQNELVALLAHEVMHCAAGHPWRRDHREPFKWNVACDRVINPILRSARFTLPQGALYELDASHLGKSAEWVYDRLPRDDTGDGNAPQQGSGSGQGTSTGRTGNGAGNRPSPSQGAPSPVGACDDRTSPVGSGTGQPSANAGACQNDTKPQGTKGDHKHDALGEVRDAPSEGATNASGASESDWQQATQQAAAIAKGQGKLPGDLTRFAKDAGKTRIDWRSALRRFVQELARGDYSFSRPNNRYVASGVVLPSLRNHEVGVIAIAVDTSGSIDSVLLAQFGAEIRSIAQEVHPRQIHVMYADAAVQRVDVFEQDDEIVLHPHGGGGTDFRPVFEHIAKWEEPPVAVIYLTDLMGTFPAHEPEWPTLWVTADGRADCPVPFGEIVGAS